LRYLIGRHARFTGSKLAAMMLADWPRYCGKFRKVMPVEYRRALAELQALQTEKPLAAAVGA
jgi:glutamate synthase (NADPH/NADH) large chain